MININNLSKMYANGIHALWGVDLVIEKGMFGLIGPNGAGKTTLMRILAGLVRPSSGSVRVFGFNPSQPKEKVMVRSMLGYLPQDLGLYLDLTGLEFLEYLASLKGISSLNERKYEVDKVLSMVNLTDVCRNRMQTYSGGMKRRVGIAQALLGKPTLLIVDEPTAGLDPEERVNFRRLLSDLAKESIVILSTHIVEDVSQSCSDLAVLMKGKVIYQGSPSQLIEKCKGKVWNVIIKNEDKLGSDLIVISNIQSQEGISYRVLGNPSSHYHSVPVEPNLEDGYMWLMQNERNR